LIPFLISSQIDIYNLSSKKKNQIIWEKYIKKNGLVIEYSFQENSIYSGYKKEYLVFRVINKRNQTTFVSWDFSANKLSGKYINRSLSNKELYFEKKIPAKSIVTGNVNNFQKGPLVVFHQFTDAKYKGKNDLFSSNFKLNNLTIK
jgi:hypothetical protein